MKLENKNILLLCADFFGYDKLIASTLTELGANVDLFDARAKITSLEKAIKKFYRGFYKKKQIKFHKEICRLNKEKKYDYIFSNSFIAREAVINYKNAFPKAKFILYLDDSIENLSGVEKTFDLYDRIASFDREDANRFDMNFRPLFFSNSYRLDEKDRKLKYDMCFIGTIHSDRLKIINMVDEYCRINNLSFFKYCYLPSKLAYFYYWITNKEYRRKSKDFFKYRSISSDDSADIMKSSKTVLDIQHPKQTGLTMRTIEAIGSQTKIITTNTDITNYDFYNSNNVLVVDRSKPVLPLDFFNHSYKKNSDNINRKYSIEGWVEDLFKEI